MTEPKDINVEVKVRNNRIIRKMRAAGIKTVAELCRQIAEQNKDKYESIHTRIRSIINMQLSARKNNGEWRTTALQLAGVFNCLPEDLFSEEQQWQALTTNRAEAEMTFAEVQYLTNGNRARISPETAAQASELRAVLAGALKELDPREQQVIRMRYYEGMQLDEIGKKIGCGKANVGKIEEEALRKLGQPWRRRELAKAAGKWETITQHEYSFSGCITETHTADRCVGLDDDILEAL